MQPLLGMGAACEPEWVTKNKDARVVVLNDTAQAVIESVRGQHPKYVFTWTNKKGRRRQFTRLNNKGWRAARYLAELGSAAPEGFRRVRVRDLKHTLGRRLRVVGVRFEDHQNILAHKSGRMTTHYSAAELCNLVCAVKRVSKSHRNRLAIGSVNT
jgi:hypothetical protein